MPSVYTVTVKKKKETEKKILQINKLIKKILFGLLLYPDGEISFHSTNREYIVSFAGSKNLKIKIQFYFR